CTVSTRPLTMPLALRFSPCRDKVRPSILATVLGPMAITGGGPTRRQTRGGTDAWSGGPRGSLGPPARIHYPTSHPPARFISAHEHGVETVGVADRTTQ